MHLNAQYDSVIQERTHILSVCAVFALSGTGMPGQMVKTRIGLEQSDRGQHCLSIVLFYKPFLGEINRLVQI